MSSKYSWWNPESVPEPDRAAIKASIEWAELGKDGIRITRNRAGDFISVETTDKVPHGEMKTVIVDNIFDKKE